MKSICIVLSMLCAGIFNGAYAQRGEGGPVTPVKVGSIVVNAGLGIGSGYQSDYYNSAFGTKAAMEFGLWQAGPGVITLGAEVGGSFSNGGYNTDFRTRTIIAAVRSAWHYGWNIRGLDTYGGFSSGPGFHHYQFKNNGNDYYDDNTFFAFGAFVGASYFVSPAFGVNVEAGHDITNVQVGIVLKLR